MSDQKPRSKGSKYTFVRSRHRTKIPHHADRSDVQDVPGAGGGSLTDVHAWAGALHGHLKGVTQAGGNSWSEHAPCTRQNRSSKESCFKRGVGVYIVVKIFKWFGGLVVRTLERICMEATTIFTDRKLFIIAFLEQSRDIPIRYFCRILPQWRSPRLSRRGPLWFRKELGPLPRLVRQIHLPASEVLLQSHIITIAYLLEGRHHHWFLVGHCFRGLIISQGFLGKC